MHLDLREGCFACQLEQNAHVVGVTLDGVRAQAPLVREMGQEAV
jgi:hypothetical protein